MLQLGESFPEGEELLPGHDLGTRPLIITIIFEQFKYFGRFFFL